MAKRKQKAKNGAAKPEPMVFQYTAPPEQPESNYDRIAKRVIAAVGEINAALKEAHECAEMSVFIAQRKDVLPLCLQYHIYRLTHSVIDVVVTYKMATPVWQQVKDPAFKVAAHGTVGDSLKRNAEKRRAEQPQPTH